MNKASIAILYRIELRAILRDRRVILFSFVLPFLLAPLLLVASRSIKRAQQDRADSGALTLAVTGARAAFTRAFVEDADRRDRSVSINFVDPPGGDVDAALRDGSIDAYLETLAPAEAKARLGDAALADVPRPPGAAENEASTAANRASGAGDLDLPILVVFYREDRTRSRLADTKIRTALSDYRRDRRDEALLTKGFPRGPPGPSWLSTKDVASEEELSGARIGRFLTAIILLLMLVGGASIASDSIAGEKERGTLETLLSAGISRSELLAAKLLLILTATVATTVIQLGNMAICVGLGLIDMGGGALDAAGAGTPLASFPLRQAPLLALLFVPMSALVASVLVLTFGMAKSYKEAQLFFAPLVIVGPVLALGAAIPGISLRSAAVLLPIVNISVAVKEILLGKYDAPMIALAWVVTAAAAALVARAAASVLSAERLILAGTGVDPRDGQARLGASVVGWFAGLWALYFVLSAGSAGAGILTSVLLGQALLVAATGLLLARYKLDPRAALSLRAPKPIVWPAVLLGAPSAAIVASGLFRLVSRVLPVPPEMLEELAKKLTPAGVPLWQAVLLFAVLPGVCEEVAFRGVLLHGLRRRLGKVALCVVVGAIFALFHIALFRLATTAFLGVLLAAVVLLSGSIFPSMLWHALNNALALVVMQLWPSEGDVPPWVYAAAILTLALSFLLLWKGRATTAPDGAIEAAVDPAKHG